MDDDTIITEPKRITDLIKLKQHGYDFALDLSFDIVPVNFAHQKSEFQAYVFICNFSGEIENKAFKFRKCYARGCPHNLCPHVAQAVMIANRYLKRDYKKLSDAGIIFEEKIFNLEDMVVKYEELDHKKDDINRGILTIHDYINIAKEGNEVDVAISLEIIPAVEHFANHKNAQTFLMADFDITTLGDKGHFQRCFACFKTENEAEEKPVAIAIANKRFIDLFNEFDDAKIQYKPCFFT